MFTLKLPNSSLSKFFILFTISVFFILLSNFAFAGSDQTPTPNTIQGFMCNAYEIFNGPLGKTFAVFAIVALGVGFFLGKVSWGTAVAVALGVGAIFGAPALVGIITGDAKATNCQTLINATTP